LGRKNSREGPEKSRTGREGVREVVPYFSVRTVGDRPIFGCEIFYAKERHIMTRSRRVIAVLSLSVGIGLSSSALRSARAAAAQQTPAPDNTKVNQRDRTDNSTTADQQKENRSDRELARQIRRAIVKDKSLSTYAHNVKVVVQNGTGTLKGPVRSEEDKKAIEGKAAEVAGE